MEYEQNQTAIRQGGFFTSEFIHTNLKFGYWFFLSETAIIEGYGGIGAGEFTFKDKNSGAAAINLNNVQMYEFGVKGIIPIKVESLGVNFDFQFGASLYQILVPAFVYESVGYNGDDFQKKNFLRILLGLGIRF